MFAEFKLVDEDAPLLLQMTKRHREILALSIELPDRSYKGVASYMGAPVGTVKSRLSRARHILIALRKQHEFEKQLLTAAVEAAHSL